MLKIPKIIDSLYIHFPFCRHLCNYCDFYKKIPDNFETDVGQFHSYLEKTFLLHENLREKHGYSWAPLKTLYIGGGTPSLWGKGGSEFLESFLKKRNITLADDREFTIEVNPGSWTEEGIKSWQKIGANRFSLGVQSLNKEMIRFLDRVHTIEDVHDTLTYFNKNKMNFSMDFMLGLPSSEHHHRDVIGELREALKYSPEHFSVYILTVKENYKHFKALPQEEWIEKEFLEVANFLQQHGYNHYEVSNFARPGKQSQHNLNYWRSHTVAALGPSATGFLSEARLRYKWTPQKPELTLEPLSEEEFSIEQMYMAVRSEVGLDLASAGDGLKTLARKWVDQGKARMVDQRFTLNSRGYLLVDSFMGEVFSRRLL